MTETDMHTTTSPEAVESARPELRQPVLGLPDPGERVPRLAWPTAALYVGTLALFALEMWGLLGWGWSRWITVPIGAAVTFLMFSVFHEATHHAVSSNTRLNNAFGHLSMPLVVAWATFPQVKFIHIEHHRNTNEPRSIDPDKWCDGGPTWLLPFRWLILDLWYVVFYLRRIRERSRTEAAMTVGTAMVAIGALGGLTVAGYGYAVLWGYLIPQRFGVLLLAWWFDYLPHHGLTATQRENKYRATRVRVGGEKLLTPLFVYQNYHLVHHLHPSVPFYSYLRAWRRNEQAYLDRNAAISTWFGRSLTPSEYRTWRRITEDLESRGSGQRPIFHPLRVSHIEQLTEDSVTVSFDVPEDLAFRYRYLQGQHITLRAIIASAEVRRSYSLVDGVSDGTLRVAVKQVDGGIFSTYVNQQLRVGDILDVMSPTGQFQVHLDPEQARHFVAVAAGSGITPIMSTIRTTLVTEPRSRFTLLYGNRTTASTMFAAELAALEQQYGDRLVIHRLLSREDGAPLPGRAGPEAAARLVPDRKAVAAWFLCGPEEMVDDISASLAGVTDPERVLREVFHPTAKEAVAVDVDVLSEVIVSLDGVETTFGLRSTAEPILDAALQHGVDPPYSCAGGACGTCKAKVLLGRAVMDQNYVLDAGEVAGGYVLTCQAHPVTAEVRIDYDA